MSFWQTVAQICEEKGINKKTIASIAGIDPSTISKGLKNSTYPSADKAVLIAQKLGTTVEYLVTGQNSVQAEINNLYKHHDIIKKIDSIPEDIRSSIELMISDMSEKYHPSK